MVNGLTDVEELKQRLRDMGTLSNSKTPKDALEYIEQLEYNNREYALEVLSALGQAQEAYEAGWNACRDKWSGMTYEETLEHGFFEQRASW